MKMPVQVFQLKWYPSVCHQANTEAMNKPGLALYYVTWGPYIHSLLDQYHLIQLLFLGSYLSTLHHMLPLLYISLEEFLIRNIHCSMSLCNLLF